MPANDASIEQLPNGSAVQHVVGHAVHATGGPDVTGATVGYDAATSGPSAVPQPVVGSADRECVRYVLDDGLELQWRRGAAKIVDLRAGGGSRSRSGEG